MQKYREYEGLPPLPVDAPQEVVDVEGATLDPEDVDETEVEESDEEHPPTPGRHQRESSSSRRVSSPPAAAAKPGESLAPVAGTARDHVILVDDDDGDDLPAGSKRSRPSAEDTKAAEAQKKHKRTKAAHDPSRAMPQHTLRVTPISSAPPKDNTGGVAHGASPPPVLKQAKLRFRGIPR